MNTEAARTPPSPAPKSGPRPPPRGWLPAAWSLATTLARCWPILLPYALLALLADTEQGRDAVAATAAASAFGGAGLHAALAQSFSVVFAMLAAHTLLTSPRRGARRTTATIRSFAKHGLLDTAPMVRWKAYTIRVVPGLVGLMAGFVPLALIEWQTAAAPKLYGEQAWLGLAQLVPIASVFLFHRWLIEYRFLSGQSLLILFALLLRKRVDWSYEIILSVLALASVGILLLDLSQPILVMFIASVLGLLAAEALRRGQPLKAYVPSHAAIWACTAIALLGGALLALDPGWWGMTAGTYVVAAVSLNAWLGFAILLWRLLGATLAGFAAILTMVLVLTGPFGAATVRFVPPEPAPAISAREHALEWLRARRVDIASARGRYPVFIVTADGGGIRSAWWTAGILARIQALSPEFYRRSFALSGVSGGSLGVAVFAAQAAQAADGLPDRERCAAGVWPDCAEDVLRQDFLGPALAAMLTVDLPRSATRTRLLPDRAASHEVSFEEAWRSAAHASHFEEPFGALWRGERRTAVPLLLLNTTDAVTARRLVLAPVTLGDDTPERGDLAPLLSGREVRLSTAVLLSARFPGISPAGRVPVERAPGHEYLIVDGGYADNSGGASAQEALRALLGAAAELGILQRIQPVAVVITNDPVPPESPPPIPPPVRARDIGVIGALAGPVATLDRLRQANTQRAREAFLSAVRSAGGCVLDGFKLRRDEATTFVLGWMLAPQARDAMAAQLAQMESEERSDLRLAAALAQPVGRPLPPCPSVDPSASGNQRGAAAIAQ
ncbi:patatin-like phospholipase family protein [Plastoroseomonas hellenica]|uniref:patatin-like phospholipase family protein n=1 Tax=Plastoroseomonas hellenica TaxID=2687306 RepID=UPI001BA4E0B4|nr:patatin-like phospholipase family protein [Plastoroseomonas hellenica]